MSYESDKYKGGILHFYILPGKVVEWSRKENGKKEDQNAQKDDVKEPIFSKKSQQLIWDWCVFRK